MNRPLVVIVLLLLCASNAIVARADVRLPAIFADHMVLQQQQPIRIWGWADKGESVTVTIGKNSQSTKADDAGRWQVTMPAMTASKEAITWTVQGNNKLEVHDVLVGEVWLCSGQSNMEWPVGACINPEAEKAAAKYPLIRHIKVPLVASAKPLDDFEADWQVCSPETVSGFTACGYFMARKLQQELDVPVGLVNASWGGTRIEPWTPPVGFQRVEALKDIYQSVQSRTPGSEAYRARLMAYITELESWTAQAQSALNSLEVLSPSPAYPGELVPFTSNQDPTMLYNGMVHAIVGFPIRGAIWYQGESNHGEGMLYFEKKKALVGGWRELWGQGDFPFYFVQIAPYQYGTEDPTILAKFWEAQSACQSITKTGMVVINDIATVNDIHPPNKQDVGLRLALQALRKDYGKTDIVADSPAFERLEVLGDRLKVHFRNAAGGLKTRDGKAPSHFEIIGVGSNGFQPAEAEIEGDAVILKSNLVKSPVACRFAWHMLAEPNLMGSTGLPVGAFRAGEEPTFVSSLSVIDDYRLIYDIDLGKLAADIQYDVDHGDQSLSFDRIGYLVELETASGQRKNIFVSMNAFTDDLKKIGIPTVASGATFQQIVESLDVYSDVEGIVCGTGIATGGIEFWPHNYGMANSAYVPNASTSIYDFGDEIAPPNDGYGSMQIHNFAAQQTLFAINHWNVGPAADIGIGNGPENTKDWTFSGNAASYPEKRLRVFVRPIQ